MDKKVVRNKIGVLGVVKKALEFLRYLEKHTASESKTLWPQRPKKKTLLLKPLEVTATSNLGHFILPYRTSIVPSFIEIGDGDFHFLGPI